MNNKVSFHLTEYMCCHITKTQEEWLKEAKQYQALWNFLHSSGANDRKQWYYRVKDIVSMNTLTTKPPSLLYVSLY